MSDFKNFLTFPDSAPLRRAVFGLLVTLNLGVSAPSLAQYTAGALDETYDPFTDYSEFEETAQEEADIYFFKHGRFVTVGLGLGMRAMTGMMGQIYSPNTTYSVHLNYFFDIRFALHVAYSSSDHDFLVLNVGGEDKVGAASMTINQLGFKYYLNTNNITRGLAFLNPYVGLGLAQANRVRNMSRTNGQDRQIATSMDFSAGIEFPLFRKKMFFGLQGTYHLLNFRDENLELVIDNTPTGLFPQGDVYDILGILGVNF